jgi:transposase-like protein
MANATDTPKTLLEAIRYFSRPGVALTYLAKLRWPNGPVCEKCGLTGDDIMFLKNAQRWKCRGCKNQFSVKRGSIMEDSPLSLDKWLCAIWMVANCKNGISSYEIHRNLGITQKSAWFLLHRIRLSMEVGGGIEKMLGPVEVDEAFIGGKVKNMSKSKRAAIAQGHGGIGPKGKAIVMGMVDRNSKQVRATVVPNAKKINLLPPVFENVERGAKVFTDALPSYVALRDHYDHESVNHFVDEYVRGEVHTNGIENFWSLLKRCLTGTYISVEPFHLSRYVDEQVFRYNHRKMNDGERFDGVLSRFAGRRMTYAALTTEQQALRC